MFPGQWGRWLSFLFVFQLCVSAPLSVASGCIGLAQYAGFLAPMLRVGGSSGAVHALRVGGYSFGVSAGRATWVAIAVVVVAVVLLYRRLAAVRGLSAGMLVVVLGTIAWAMVTGVLHGQWSRVVAWSGPQGTGAGAWRLDHGFFVGLGVGDADCYVRLLGVLQRYVSGGRGARSGADDSSGGADFDGVVAVLYLGLNASVLAVMGAPAIVGGAGYWGAAGAAERDDAGGVFAGDGLGRGDGVGQAGGGAGDGDGVCERVFAAAGVFADTVCGGRGMGIFRRSLGSCIRHGDFLMCRCWRWRGWLACFAFSRWRM